MFHGSEHAHDSPRWSGGFKRPYGRCRRPKRSPGGFPRGPQEGFPKSTLNGCPGSSFWESGGFIWGFWASHFGGVGGSGSQGRLGRHLGRLQGGFRPQHGPNLGPKMAPSWSKNRTKNDTKIAYFEDAFKNAILNDLGWIFGRKMEPSWGQDRIKNRSYLEMCEKRKTIVKPMKF